jgi:Mor family transcriptional regulator
MQLSFLSEPEQAEVLSANMQLLADNIGMADVMKLIALYRDIEWCYIPAQIPANHPLSMLSDKAQAYLTENYRGERIAIPRGKGKRALLLEQRNAEIRAKRKAGALIRELMREYDLSAARVFEIL